MTEFAKPSPELVRLIEALGDAHVNIVIHNGVCLDVSRFDDVPLLHKFGGELTEARKAEIIAVFGPGPHFLDWEFLQDFVRPAVTDKLSRFWPDNIDTKKTGLDALTDEQLWEMFADTNLPPLWPDNIDTETRELDELTDEQLWEMFADTNLPPLPPKPAG